MITIEDLSDLEQESIQQKIPIIGSQKAKWLQEIIKHYSPQEILELGTANGYSGIILASGDGHLTTIEKKQDLFEQAKKNFQHYGINATTILGDGVEIVTQKAIENHSIYDLIFIDFAKHKYITVLLASLTLLKPGGILIADNISHPHCQNFKDAILQHPQLATTIIPIKDGLSMSIKQKE